MRTPSSVVQKRFSCPIAPPEDGPAPGSSQILPVICTLMEPGGGMDGSCLSMINGPLRLEVMVLVSPGMVMPRSHRFNRFGLLAAGDCAESNDRIG